MDEYRFFRLYSIDIEMAQQSLGLLSEHNDPAVRFCILRDAIVSYTRPFSRNRGKCFPGTRKHPAHALSEEFVPELRRPLHRELVALRNGAFAHTDPEFHDPSISRWHRNDGRPLYLMRFRTLPMASLDARVSEIIALAADVELNVEGWISWFERQYKPA